MTVTLTPIQPSENDVINAASFVVRVAASSDAGTITGVSVGLNNGTVLAMTFDSALGQWTKSLALPLGPSVVKVIATDSVAGTKTIYINFSRSSSTNGVASIVITHPTEGSTMRSPGVILQADISRTSDIVLVEASVDQGATWVRMAIPASTGGS